MWKVSSPGPNGAMSLVPVRSNSSPSWQLGSVMMTIFAVPAVMEPLTGTVVAAGGDDVADAGTVPTTIAPITTAQNIHQRFIGPPQVSIGRRPRIGRSRRLASLANRTGVSL